VAGRTAGRHAFETGISGAVHVIVDIGFRRYELEAWG